MMIRHVPFAAVLAFACCGAAAQSQAPGLWEHTFSTASKGGEQQIAIAMAQQQLAALPPEQRRQVEQMMAKNGVTLNSGGVTVKACVTAQQAARPAEPTLPEGCTHETAERNGNHIKVRFRCTRPQPSSGEAEVTFTSDKAYTGSSIATTEIAGAPRQLSMTMAGHWIAPDCGDVKPVAVPAR